MASLTTAKHLIGEIDGTIVTPAWYRQLGGDTEVPYYNYGKTEVADQYE